MNFKKENKNSVGIVTLLKNGSEIVISGISGRFPESNTMDEFAENLFNNVDMITEDDRRWPTDLYNMNPRMGKLKDIEKFDGSFFGMMANIGDSIDPHSRILLETTYEAICDAGINPQTLRGTNTGVYVGYSSIGMNDATPQELQKDINASLYESTLWIAGPTKSMYSNRVSYLFDFHGPSMTIDTACSSSIVALDIAVTDLRLGKCDYAIVAGTNVNLQPYTNHIYQTNHFNADDGISKVWDKDANGYVRAETVSTILLQKKTEAKRIYATVIHSRTNIDGHKKMGMFFPSTVGQRELMERVYSEAEINPNDISYFEAHGTGTKVGDPQEARAIANAYCKNRSDPLPVGLLKSNIGHAEGASGIASIAKVLIAFENKCIPANLNLKQLKSEIAQMVPPLMPINKNMPYNLGIAGINSFGVGGVNGHVLLKSHDKEPDDENSKIILKIPRLINVCGRTPEAVNHIFDFIEKNPKKVTREFLTLLGDIMKVIPLNNTVGFPNRGFILIKEANNDNGEKMLNYDKDISVKIGDTKPIWFMFSGMGNQWIGMAKALMIIDTFSKSIYISAQILKQNNVDLLHLLLDDDDNALDSVTHSFVAITSVQIAIVDLLNELNIHADGFIGHSFGEIACAYADGSLTHEQTVLTSYWRGKIIEDVKVPIGMMAAVGLSWDNAKQRCHKDITVACYNAPDSVTISGITNDVKNYINTLKEENVFVREVNCNNVPFHSNLMDSVSEKLTLVLKTLIPVPILRSKKWYSTSVPESKWSEESAKYASAEYFVNNLLSPVLFYPTLKHAPKDAIVIEIAPHTLFSNLIKRSLESATYIGLIKRNNNEQNLEMFLKALGKLYQCGVNVAIEHLYPKVQYPVSRTTQSISSLIKWDHKDTYLVKKFPEYNFHATASDLIFKYSLSNIDDAFLSDHKIDDRVVFPATGYLMLAWRRLAASRGQQWNQFPVVFENVQFRRVTLFSENGIVKLTVRYLEPTGEFVILESGNITAFGRIYVPDDETLQMQHLLEKNSQMLSSELTFNTYDIYKEFRIRGYDYGPKFQRITEIKLLNINEAIGKVQWNGNIITYLDSILQMYLTIVSIRETLIPISIGSLRCDPKLLYESIEEVKEMIIDNEQKEIKEVHDLKETLTNYSLNTDKREEKCENSKVKSHMEYFKQFTNSHQNKFLSILPLTVDINLKAIVSNGIEIRNLIPAIITRKPLVQGLNLEKYLFIPNHDNEAIDTIYKHNITEYIQICNSMARNVLQANGITIEHLMNDIKEVDPIIVEKMVNNLKDDHILFKIFKEIRNKNIIENNINVNMKNIIENPELHLSNDILNRIEKNERLIRPMIDIVNENVSIQRLLEKEINVLEINVNNTFMGKEIEQIFQNTFIMNVSVNYTVALKSPDTIDQNSNNHFIQFIQWDYQKSIFPNMSDLDLVIHRDIFESWNIDLKYYLKEAFNSIKDGGFLMGIFRSKLTSPERALYYLQNNNIINDMKLNNRIKTFTELALDMGFRLICNKTDSILSSAILFKKVKNEINTQQTVININSQYDQWIDTLKMELKEHKEKPDNENIWLIGNDISINGIIGLTLCLRQEPGGERIRCIFDYDSKLPLPIDFNKKPYNDLLINDLAVNVFCNGKFGSLRHLNIPKNNETIETTEACVNIMQCGDLSSLQWNDATNVKYSKFINYDIGSKFDNRKVHCEIYYAALNFRDVMFASAKIISGHETAVIDNIIGTEFAGRRTDTGERVCGVCMGSAIGTSVNTDSKMLNMIPENWTMEEAATISTVYFTVWYGLIHKANLKEEESVLIHSGTGGVGQAAIIVCQYFKCNIFTTVGTDEKREFLKQKYNIPDDHIFSSRHTHFEEKLFKATDGRGVDIVLNSLAGDKLQASFRCVADDGRFIEIGKYDLQMNKHLYMHAFLRNISFHGISIERMFQWGYDSKKYNETMDNFSKWISDGVKNGYVRPINRTIFASDKVEKAFRYMTTGKHIGKVLIKIRHEEPDKIVLNPKEIKIMASTKTWFHPNKVYIIIGGLGGFGLELSYWMTMRGAKKLVLTSRTGIKNNFQKYIFKLIEYLGQRAAFLKVNINVSTENAVTFESATKLIEESSKIGPIGGVFNLAAVLNDTVFENQTVDTFKETCEPKVDVMVNLDKITRNQCPQLDYFVAFSSISCGRGNFGQTNYGYANSVMERICEKRRSDKLHGLAIQWGPIADVGLLEDVSNEKMKIAGVIMQRIASCINVLDRFLQCPYPVVSSIIKAERRLQNGSMEENTINQLWTAIGVDPKTIPDHVTMGELGIESMIAVEFQQKLERIYDISLTIPEIRKITVGEIKEIESGNKETVKLYAADIKNARINLSKIKFDIPKDSISKLNDVKEGIPIYFLPPIEGIFSLMMNLAQRINRPVIGLNWTQELEGFNSVKEIALYFINLIKTLPFHDDCHIITYSFGSVIALKMLHKRASIGKLIIVDAFDDYDNSDNQSDDTFKPLMEFINKNTPKQIILKFKNNILNVKDKDEKMKRLVQEMKDFGGKSIVGKDFEAIVRGCVKRGEMIIQYQKKLAKKLKNISKLKAKMFKIKSKIIVVKSTEDNHNDKLINENILKAYGISSEIFEEKYDLKIIKGLPKDIMKNDIQNLIDIINQVL